MATAQATQMRQARPQMPQQQIRAANMSARPITGGQQPLGPVPQQRATTGELFLVIIRLNLTLIVAPTNGV